MPRPKGSKNKPKSRGPTTSTRRRQKLRRTAVKQVRIRAETKSRTHAEMSIGSEAAQSTTIVDPTVYYNIQNDDAFTYIPPLSWMSMTQGTHEDQMIGTSVFSKYLKLKMSLIYPHGADMSAVPSNQYVVHGWLKTRSNNVS